jgi:hypothetical protein
VRNGLFSKDKGDKVKLMRFILKQKIKVFQNKNVYSLCKLIPSAVDITNIFAPSIAAQEGDG